MEKITGEILPIDTSLFFPIVFVGVADVGTLVGARMAAILTKLYSSS